MRAFDIPEAFVNFCADSDTGSCRETYMGCTDSVGACYPMNVLEDLHFQVLIGELTGNDADLIISGEISFKISLSPNCESCEPTITEADIICDLEANPWKSSGGDQNDYFVLSSTEWQNQTLLNDYAAGDCFVLCLWKAVPIEGPSPTYTYTKLGCSPCFIKTSETCDTSVIYYRNNENSFGFYNNGDSFYDDYFNSIRLPFKLCKPQPKGTKSGYLKSDGTYKKTAAQKGREWIGETEHMSEQWHTKLDIALDCDQVKITNSNAGITDQYVFCEEENSYKVDWLEAGPEDVLHAPATFKVMEYPYNEFNNNCGADPPPPDEVTIKDQDGVTIDTVACGSSYSVIVFSGIDGGNSTTIYSNSIIAP